MPPDDPGTAQEAATAIATAATDAATVSATGAGSAPTIDTATPGIAAAETETDADGVGRSPQALAAPLNVEKVPAAATSTAPSPSQPAASAPDSSVTHATAADTTVISTTLSGLPATVAADALASQPQHQNGDSKAPETDVDMANHPSSAHHASSMGYPHIRSIPSTTGAVASAPPVTSAYGLSVGITPNQYTTHPATTVASQANDGYRASPVPSSTAVTLPSMRTIDSITQQQQRLSQPPVPHHTASMGMSTPLASVPSTTVYYSPQHGLPLPSSYGLGSDSLARYPLPHDPRILGSRTSKKVRIGPLIYPTRERSTNCLGP